MKTSVLTVSVLAVMAGVVAAQELDPEQGTSGGDGKAEGWEIITPRFTLWFPALYGMMESDEGTSLNNLTDGTKLSIDDELGMDEDPQVIPYFEFVVAERSEAPGEFHVWEHFSLGFYYGCWEGDEELDDEEVFNGVTLPAGTDVESRLEFWMASMDVSVVSLAQSRRSEWEFFLGVRVWDIDMRVDSNVTSSTDEKLRLGLIGGGVGWRMHWSEVAGIELRTGGYFMSWEEDTWWEYEEGAAVQWEGLAAATFDLKGVRVRAGFRAMALAATALREDSDSGEEVDVALTLGGPFADISLPF